MQSAKGQADLQGRKAKVRSFTGTRLFEMGYLRMKTSLPDRIKNSWSKLSKLDEDGRLLIGDSTNSVTSRARTSNRSVHILSDD